MKKLLAAFVLLSLVTVLVAACGGKVNTSNLKNVVHMGDQNFVQTSVTITKGESINLVDDTATIHIIANGSWVNGGAQPMQEDGAPTVNNLQFNGNDVQLVGPFNIAGTFHLFCTIHPDMNLTVIVQ